VLREYAGAVRADVVSEGPLSIASRACQRREAHHNDNRQPPFDSASRAVVQRDLAQILTGSSRGVAAREFSLRTFIRIFGDNRLTLARRWFLCVVPCKARDQTTGPPSATSRPYWVAFVDASNKQVKTLVL